MVVAAALVLSVAAVTITYAFPSLAQRSTFLLSFAAVTAAGWYGGGMGGLVATAATSAMLDLLILAPAGHLEVPLTTDLRFATFIAISLLTTGFNWSLHRAARRVRSSENLARLLIDSAPILIAAADQDGRIVLFNGECERLTGHRAADVIGTPFLETLVPTTWRATVRQRLESDSDVELAIAHRDGWLMRDGSERLIEWRCYRIPTPTGLVTIGLGHDVTDRQRMETELREAVEDAELSRQEAADAVAARERFIATLAHELRSPIAAALGWSEMLVKQAGTAETRRLTERIARAHRLIERLINDVNDLASIDAGKVSLNPRTIMLNDVITAAVESVSPLALAKDVRIDVVANTPLPLWGDPDRLQQAVLNLLTNALKFSTEQGEIIVRAGRQGDTIELTVEDGGPGISDSDAERVFEPFWQSDASKGGLGLGLALVRQIAVLHRGSATIRRARKDGGTIARVTLPMAVGSARKTAS